MHLPPLSQDLQLGEHVILYVVCFVLVVVELVPVTDVVCEVDVEVTVIVVNVVCVCVVLDTVEEVIVSDVVTVEMEV